MTDVGITNTLKITPKMTPRGRRKIDGRGINDKLFNMGYSGFARRIMTQEPRGVCYENTPVETFLTAATKHSVCRADRVID